jgi:hypothetical protein
MELGSQHAWITCVERLRGRGEEGVAKIEASVETSMYIEDRVF